MTHDFALWLSKSFGLFYLLAMVAGVLIYAFWPTNKARFDAAARAILDDKDQPDDIIGTYEKSGPYEKDRPYEKDPPYEKDRP